ncbi:MAG: arginase family protein, partial [Fidelibacterota bacterium]
HLDAHPDLYDELDGNRYSHGCPFARVMEEKLIGRLVQIGIRAPNAHQREQIARFGVEVFELRHWTTPPDLTIDGPLYLSVDLDVFDPAFAPGIAHHEPGGLSPRDVIQIIQNIQAPLVGADIVEFNPTRDPLGITAMLAAKLLKEIAGRMLELS